MNTERPSAFVSYAQSGPEWQRIVLQFTTCLRKVGGVDAELDLFHQTAHRNWTNFGPRLIEDSDVTLIAVDAAYRRRWQGTETEGVGAGSAREAAAIKAIFDRSEKEFLRRIKVVLLPGASVADIPADLSGAERFEIASFDEKGVEGLLRSLWGKPAVPKPDLGPIPSLPPKAIAEIDGLDGPTAEPSDGRRGADAEEIDEHDRDKLKRRLEELELKLAEQSGGHQKDGASTTDERERERAVLETSLEVLNSSRATKTGRSAGVDGISPRLRPFLVGLDDPDESVRMEAIMALGDRLEPSLLPKIESLLDDSDSFVRRYALEYYSQLAGQEATPRLVAALDDSDESVRMEAIMALGDRLEPSLLPKIESLLDDSDSFVRRYALEYYSQLTN